MSNENDLGCLGYIGDEIGSLLNNRVRVFSRRIGEPYWGMVGSKCERKKTLFVSLTFLEVSREK